MRLVKIDGVWFNPEHVAVVLPSSTGYKSSIIMRDGTKFGVAMTANEAAEALIGLPEYGSGDL